MDVLGSAASLGQLAVYVHCAVSRLRHLYETFKTATFLARSQLEELQVLLKILDRIEEHHSPSDTELLVPLLISIADAVQTLQNWFDPSSTLRLKWNLIAHQFGIEEEFRLLRQKYNLLVFYYSERNNCALSRIESTLNAHHHAALGSSGSMSSPKTQDSPTLEVSLCFSHNDGSSSQTFDTNSPIRNKCSLSRSGISSAVMGRRRHHTNN